jgi:hypothetical protein
MSVQSSYSSQLTKAIEGQLADAGAHDVLSMVNNEAAAEMGFGLAVCFEGSTDDQGALAPDDVTDKIAGILMHSHDYSQSDLGDTGLLPGATLNILRKGRIWVRPEEAVAPGDRLFIRAEAAGEEREGAVRMSADGADCIDSTTQGVFLTSAEAGELAVLEVDFTNDPTDAT